MSNKIQYGTHIIYFPFQMSVFYIDEDRSRKKIRPEDIPLLLASIPSGSDDDMDSDSDEDIGTNASSSNVVGLQVNESELSSSLLDVVTDVLPAQQENLRNLLGENDAVDLLVDHLPFEMQDDGEAYIEISSQQDTSEGQILLSPYSSSTSECRPSEIFSNQKQSTSTQPCIAKKKATHITWKKKNMNIPNKQKMFSGTTATQAFLQELETPFQLFKYFFGKELVQKILFESTQYSASKNPNKPFELTEDDLHRFIGILIFSSVCKYSNIRLYWDKSVGVEMVQKAMCLNTFEKIRAVIHFNNNAKQVLDRSSEGYDKLYKLRPVLNEIGKKFLTIPMEESLSVDEQMCSTKARHHMKQYMPKKPHKWGYKLFVLCGVSGFAYKFEIYTGTDNEAKTRLSQEPDFGASGNVVVRLCRDVPNGVNHKLYFDNYYTSVPLVSYLAGKGILSLGTVRRNRIPQCKLPTDEQMKKKDRGYSIEYCTTYENTEISNVLWKDNKCVTLISTFVGTQPEGTIARFDRREKVKKTVKCPAIIREYNRHMGGVDLLDSLLGRYHISMRTRKWYMRLFYHIIDITVINAWLLHRRMHVNSMKLLEFRLELATTLCAIGCSSSSKRGRPSSEVQKQYALKKSKGPAARIPPPDVRRDTVNHFPTWNSTRIRCKLPACPKQTYVMCSKCGVGLCFNKDTNCFMQFHSS